MLAMHAGDQLSWKAATGIYTGLLMAVLMGAMLFRWGAPNHLNLSSRTLTAAAAYLSAEQPIRTSSDTHAVVANDSHTGRYIFIDLGANKADTLKVFLGYPDAKFNFDFVTPPDERSPRDAEIFLFEANVRSLSTPCIRMHFYNCIHFANI